MPGIPTSGQVAVADYRTKQYHLMRIGSTGAIICGDGQRVDGILLNKPNTGEAVTLETNDGVIEFVMAGASFTRGSELAANASGRAITALSGDEAFAIADEDASGDGSIVRVLTRFRGGLTG